MFIKTKATLVSFIFCNFIILLFPKTAFSQTSTIFINEVFPAPTSGNLEWVELYNSGDTSVDLSGYTLKDASGSQLTFSGTSIDAKGYISATSSNILNNGGDTVTLRDGSNQIIATLTYESISTNNAYARCPDGTENWITLTTPSQNSSNDALCPSPTAYPSLTPVPSATSIPTNTPAPTSNNTTEKTTYDNVYISEVMVAPETGQKEWVELYNDNDFTVNLSNWYIDDEKEAGSSVKKFTLSIPAKSYGVYELSTGIFNNDADSVRLLDSYNNVIHEFNYEDSEKGYSWGKNTDNTFCLQIPSKSTTNTSCINLEDEESSSTSSNVSSSNSSAPNLVSYSQNFSAGSSHLESTSNNYAIQPQIFSSSENDANDEPEVLGTQTETKKTLPPLLFLSLSYSLLSLVSLTSKIVLTTV